MLLAAFVLVGCSEAPLVGPDGAAAEAKIPSVTVPGNCQLVYGPVDFATASNDFKWSTWRIAGDHPTNNPFGANNVKFMGRFHDDSTTLTLSSLPTHQHLYVTADVYAIGFWDSSNSWGGRETFLIDVVGGGNLLTTRFPHGLTHSALSRNTLGYEWTSAPANGGRSIDAKYGFVLHAMHTGSELAIRFKGGDTQPTQAGKNSWGIANLQVCVAP